MKGLKAYDPHAVEHIWREFADEMKAKGVTDPRIVIEGGYGKENTGDDAILEVILERVRAVIPRARITVLCFNPESIARDYRVTAHYFRSWGMVRSVLDCDLMVVGGGGMVNKINTYSGFRVFRWLDPKGKLLFINVMLAKMRRRRAFFYIVGATSIPDPVVKWLARRAFTVADHVSVRDPLSKELLESIGVENEIAVVFDPVVELEPIPEMRGGRLLREEGVDPYKLVIGVSFRLVADPAIDNDAVVAEAAKLIDWMISAYDAQVLFIPMSRHPGKEVENDLVFAERLRERLAKKKSFVVMRHARTPAEIKGMMGLMDFCVFMRLHACILATPMKTPFVTISYSEKVSEFVKMTGQEKYMMELADFKFEKASQLVEAMVAAKVAGSEGRVAARAAALAGLN